MKERIETLAEELYNWTGRYGSHGGVLWKDARGSKQQEYIVEAGFILREFIEKLFGYRPLSLLKQEVAKLENPYIVSGLIPEGVLHHLDCFEDCRRAILKVLEK